MSDGPRLSASYKNPKEAGTHSKHAAAANTLQLGIVMNDFRKHYLDAALISTTLDGCGGGNDGSAVVIDPEPLPPPAATPAVNAGDDQNVIEDDLVSLEATTSGFSGNASLIFNWRRVDGPYMIFSYRTVGSLQI